MMDLPEGKFRTWDWQDYLKYVEDMISYITTCEASDCIYYEKGEGCTKEHIDLDYSAPLGLCVDENGKWKKRKEIPWAPTCLSYYRM